MSNAMTTDRVSTITDLETQARDASPAEREEIGAVLADARREVGIDAAIALFVASAQGVVDAYHARHFPTQGKILTVENGKRYARIVATTTHMGITGSRSAYCFVDRTNGDILKAASWKAPAKHARGSVYAADPTQAVTSYGANYFR